LRLLRKRNWSRTKLESTDFTFSLFLPLTLSLDISRQVTVMPTDRQPRAASQAAIKKMSPPAKDSKETNNKSSDQATTSKSNKASKPHPTYQEMILVSLSLRSALN